MPTWSAWRAGEVDGSRLLFARAPRWTRTIAIPAATSPTAVDSNPTCCTSRGATGSSTLRMRSCIRCPEASAGMMIRSPASALTGTGRWVASTCPSGAATRSGSLTRGSTLTPASNGAAYDVQDGHVDAGPLPPEPSKVVGKDAEQGEPGHRPPPRSAATHCRLNGSARRAWRWPAEQCCLSAAVPPGQSFVTVWAHRLQNT